jgi:ATP-dependent Lon protease
MMPGKGKMTVTGNLRDVMKESISGSGQLCALAGVDFGIEPPTLRQEGHSRPRARRRNAEGRPVGRCRHGDGHRLDDDRYSGAPGCRHDRRDHAARQVLPIGGLKEKLLAALRGGIKTVLIPEDNAKDLADIPTVKNGLRSFRFPAWKRCLRTI